jgi:hypothetical protein
MTEENVPRSEYVTVPADKMMMMMMMIIRTIINDWLVIRSM